ncbi:MAG: PD-(D/E)XK nuclease family transposase [Blautia sp.]|nr:PD-(D/E)XK nuclease family transposase [Blautia sp.]
MTKDNTSVSSPDPAQESSTDNRKISEEAPELTTNLSDFALFLTIMKDKTAYRNTLSIILDEKDLRLKEVKVEQVILNKSGKRAIRLDAWALSADERQFDMEMQNESNQDSLPRRSRFYQGLMDSPTLKAGKQTKYRDLPSSTIIFITRDDIFKKDLAKYTFTEQCEEVAGLKLEDGTTKIFLNMTSKNGSQELVSLLQYMKNTDINNPEITVKDERLLILDKIVTSVKQSEEWEAVSMDLIDIGFNRGIQQGISQGISQGELKNLISQISKKRSKNCSVAETADMLETEVSLVQKVYDALERYNVETQWQKIMKLIE